MGYGDTFLNRLNIIAVGNKQTSWARQAEQEYCKRLAEWKAQILTVKVSKGNKALQIEAERLRKKIPQDSVVVACVAGQNSPTSEQLTKLLSKWFSLGNISFLVGGRDGLDADLLNEAHYQLSLSALTFAHDVARVVLLEQCYRCKCIMQNHPYHAN